MLDFMKRLVLDDKRKILSADKARKFTDYVNERKRKLKKRKNSK